MLTHQQRGRHDRGAGGVCGRVEIADHVLFASDRGEDWCVVVNGVVVDQFTNRYAALDLIGRLARALRPTPTAAEQHRRAQPWSAAGTEHALASR